ncbi:nascent polypeptide-associated complex protein [Candidatus Woesearchaeota archaeon]|jgi:nascent polypeptide-associated complex subunit alpha|nr:nascent polypeptide-associated complex protein [Candidatus Woesearchaeota archaeon]
MNPAQLQKAMKKFGIQQQDIDAIRVIIETPETNLVFENPSVARVSMGGQDSFQVVGEPVETPKESGPAFTEEDVTTVAGQASVDEDKARAALEKSEGDLAAAILDLDGA